MKPDRVDVYRNLHRRGLAGEPVWSVRRRREGVTFVERLGLVLLARPRLVVNPGGRAQALREGRKCVHAFARGELAEALPRGLDRSRALRVTYSPFSGPDFTDRATGAAVREGEWAELGPEGLLVWV